MGPMEHPRPQNRRVLIQVQNQIQNWVGIALALLVGLGASSCQPDPVPWQPSGFSASNPLGARFSSTLAWQHLEALVAIGPRVIGTDGLDRARDYIEGELRELHLRVETHTGYIPIPPEGERGFLVKSLIAVVPGASEDIVVLAAPFDTRASESDAFMGANEGASGAAVLLELARVLSENPLPYTTWLVFLGGEAAGETGVGVPSNGQLGSAALAESFVQDDLNRRVLILTVLTRVGAADLQIARDLRSIRKFRNEFFLAANRLGHGEVFRSDQPFESPVASHHPFLSRGLSRVVLLSDSVVSNDVDAETEDGENAIETDTLEDCSPESLGIVGAVTLEALRTITGQLVRIARVMGQESGEPIEVPLGFSKAAEAEEAATPVEPAPEAESPAEAPSERQENPETAASSTGSAESDSAEDGDR